MSLASVHEREVTPVTRIEIIRPDNPTRWAEAFAIEADVFIQSGYVADADELAREYEPFLGASMFFAMTDNEELRGVVRIIEHSDAGFKTVVDAQNGKLQIDQDWLSLIATNQKDMFEVGTIAVPPEFRTKDSGRASMWLYGAILGYSRRNGLPAALASFDAEYFDGFTKKLFRDGVLPIGPPVEYMGSFTIPAYMKEHEAYASICSEAALVGIKEVLDQAAQQIIDA